MNTDVKLDASEPLAVCKYRWHECDSRGVRYEHPQLMCCISTDGVDSAWFPVDAIIMTAQAMSADKHASDESTVVNYPRSFGVDHDR